MKVHAFTLAETMLALFIAGCLVALSLFLGKNTLPALREKMFFNELRQTWFAMIYKAEKQRATSVVFFKNHEVIFESEVGGKETKLEYPQTLTLSPQSSDTLILSPKGALHPTTEVFISSLGKRYELAFQLGYGAQYRIEESLVTNN